MKKDKSIGVECRIDDLGRIVIPKKMRDKLDFRKNEIVSIRLHEQHIEISKSKSVCFLCGTEEDLNNYNNHSICNICVEDISTKLRK